MALPGMSPEAQEKLSTAKVAIAGMGGVGLACAGYLANAGVGHLIIIDPASVRLEDLPEQSLIDHSDIGTLKVIAAKRHLQRLNPSIKVTSEPLRLATHTAENFIRRGDIIVDCMGNWQDKLSASDVCMQQGKTLVHAGVRGYEFQIYAMIPGRSACLRCLFADTGIEDVVSSDDAALGTLGPVAAMAGSFQAIEVIKMICGLGATPATNLTKFDALRRYVDQIIELGPRSGCPDCDSRAPLDM